MDELLNAKFDTKIATTGSTVDSLEYNVLTKMIVDNLSELIKMPLEVENEYILLGSNTCTDFKYLYGKSSGMSGRSNKAGYRFTMHCRIPDPDSEDYNGEIHPVPDRNGMARYSVTVWYYRDTLKSSTPVLDIRERKNIEINETLLKNIYVVYVYGRISKFTNAKNQTFYDVRASNILIAQKIVSHIDTEYPKFDESDFNGKNEDYGSVEENY